MLSVHRDFSPEPSDNRLMTAEQAATLKQLAIAAYELDAFKPNLKRSEADLRIAALTAKLKLLDGPPHTSEPWSPAVCSPAFAAPIPVSGGAK